MFAILDTNGALDHYANTNTGLPAGFTAVALPVGFDPLVEAYDPAMAMVVENQEAYERDLIGSINKERATAVSLYLTTGAGKNLVYAAKAGEVRDYAALSQEERDTLSWEDEQLFYPFLRSDADAFNDTMNDALARFKDGIERSMLNIARVEAAFQRAKNDIANATTAEAMQDAANLSLALFTYNLVDENGDYLVDEHGARLR